MSAQGRVHSAQSAPTAAMRAPSGPPRLYRLGIRDLWNFMRRQRASYLLVCAYLFFEYVRPQTIYDFMSDWPLASVTILLCIAACVLEGFRARRLTLIDPLLVLYTAIVLLSIVTAYDPRQSLADVGTSYIAWILVYILITTLVSSEQKFLVFSLLYCLWSYKMAQHGVRSFLTRGLSFEAWGVSCAPGFFQNSGECGIQMAMYFPFSLHFVLALKAYWDRKRKWFLGFMPVAAAITIMATSSRGAQLALAVTLVWLVMRSRQRFRVLAVGAVGAALLYAILPAEQLERFHGMGTDDTSQARLQYWRDGIEIMNAHPLVGIGFNNWLEYYRSNYDPRGQLPHNIFVQAGAELGYPGLLAFVLLIVATFVVNAQTRRMAKSMGVRGRFLWSMAHGLDGALLGYLVSGFFVTVLYYPFFWINLALTVALQTAVWNDRVHLRRQLRDRPAPVSSPIPSAVNPRAGPSTPWARQRAISARTRCAATFST